METLFLCCFAKKYFISLCATLTHWGRDKMADISQTTLSNVFSLMKLFEFQLTFHWNLFLRFQLTIFQHWFRWWLGAVQATSHYLKQWWQVYWRIYASLGLNELNKSWPVSLTKWKTYFFFFIIPPRIRKLVGGGGCILVSLRPSIRLSVRPPRIPCPLCSAYSFGWINFILTHLIKQLQKMCSMYVSCMI